MVVLTVRGARLNGITPTQSTGTVSADRQCGSSQQSLHFAAQGMMSGAYDVVVATTLTHGLREHGGRFGLQAMCEAGGLANAMVVERL